MYLRRWSKSSSSVRVRAGETTAWHRDRQSPCQRARTVSANDPVEAKARADLELAPGFGTGVELSSRRRSSRRYVAAAPPPGRSAPVRGEGDMSSFRGQVVEVGVAIPLHRAQVAPASAHLLTALTRGCPGVGRRGQTSARTTRRRSATDSKPRKAVALLASKSRRKGRPRLGRQAAERTSAAPVSSRADRRTPRGWQ